jgi:ferredoxin-NADP reductase
MTTTTAAEPVRHRAVEHSTETDLDLVVADREEVADGVVRLTLRHPDGAPLPEWRPGAHVDLVLGDGLVRQYSLCGDLADRHSWQVGVLREPAGRGGSEYIHTSVHAGSAIHVRGPRNNFPLAMSGEYLFIAGGIGITPMLPMVAEAEAAGSDWQLFYCGRARTSMAFQDDLVARYGDRVTVNPSDECGRLDLQALLGTPPPGTLVYSCGPGSLIAAVEEQCAAWPAGSLHVERFSPKAMEEPFLQGPFEVELAQTGTVVEVPPDKSILAAVSEAGVYVMSSCAEGTCGTCETDVLEGEVDHRDSILSPEERAAGETMMICVSRARCPRLVLDL